MVSGLPSRTFVIKVTKSRITITQNTRTHLCDHIAVKDLITHKMKVLRDESFEICPKN